MIEIIPNFYSESNKPIYVQLYEYIKNEIIESRIEAGEKLPSIRQMAKNLCTSRTTIENTYYQLNMEGYIYSVPQKGYYVSKFEKVFLKDDNKNLKYLCKEKQDLSTKTENLVDKKCFNFNLWRKYINRVLMEYEERLLVDGDNQGEYELRYEISKYVYRARAVLCRPEQIVVGAGVQTLIAILSVILQKQNYKEIAFEDPGFKEPHHIFNSHKLNILPVTLQEDGIDIDILEKSGAKICYVSPSHQFPTGSIMSISKRMQLLKWAEINDGLIIEDDYDSELRYSGRPIPSLQSLDKGHRVIYLGSFSTLLIPSIRMSYMILTRSLLKIYNEIKNEYNQTVSKIDQITLALYMKEGEFEKHIRRLRKLYAKKNQVLIEAIDRTLGCEVKTMGTESGLNIILQVNEKLDVNKIIQSAEEIGIKINSISNYSIKKNKKFDHMLMLSYKEFQIEKINEIVQKIKNILQ